MLKSKIQVTIAVSVLVLTAFLVMPNNVQLKAQTSTSGVLIPMYIYPTDPAWSQVISIHNAHPGSKVDIIANVNSGPGTAVNNDYVTGIANMRANGIPVLGYVFTSYCARPLNAAAGDIQLWRVFYPNMNGILLDQMQNNPNTSCAGGQTPSQYYKTLAGSAKYAGFNFVVGNPGTQTNQQFVGTVDTMIIYENPGTPSISTLQANTFNGAFPKTNFAYDAYNVPALNDTFVQQSTNYVGWLYITNDNLPNPYDTIPPYLDQEVHDVCGC